MSAEVLGLIEDGYTESGYIAAVPQLHPALRFRFRPLLTEERTAFLKSIANTDRSQQDKKATALVKDRLQEWDLCGRDGAVVPLTADVIKRLKPRLFERLFGIVLGSDAPDEDPEANQEDRDQLSADKETAQQAGQPFQQIREARDQKNS